MNCSCSARCTKVMQTNLVEISIRFRQKFKNLQFAQISQMKATMMTGKFHSNSRVSKQKFSEKKIASNDKFNIAQGFSMVGHAVT